MVTKLLKDPKHWIGWIITTGVVVSIFHVLNVPLYQPWWYVLILLGVITVIDLIKHKIGLQ